jgi:hypothetical protein
MMSASIECLWASTERLSRQIYCAHLNERTALFREDVQALVSGFFAN